jgi:hypothetical protein
LALIGPLHQSDPDHDPDAEDEEHPQEAPKGLEEGAEGTIAVHEDSILAGGVASWARVPRIDP